MERCWRCSASSKSDTVVPSVVRPARGMVPVGHSWPRSDNNGRQWIQDHTVNGCEPGVFIELGGGAPRDNYTVGGGGGYGAFYCFALGATPPPP